MKTVFCKVCDDVVVDKDKRKNLIETILKI